MKTLWWLLIHDESHKQTKRSITVLEGVQRYSQGRDVCVSGDESLLNQASDCLRRLVISDELNVTDSLDVEDHKTRTCCAHAPPLLRAEEHRVVVNTRVGTLQASFCGVCLFCWVCGAQRVQENRFLRACNRCNEKIKHCLSHHPKHQGHSNIPHTTHTALWWFYDSLHICYIKVNIDKRYFSSTSLFMDPLLPFLNE